MKLNSVVLTPVVEIKRQIWKVQRDFQESNVCVKVASFLRFNTFSRRGVWGLSRRHCSSSSPPFGAPLRPSQALLMFIFLASSGFAVIKLAERDQTKQIWDLGLCKWADHFSGCSSSPASLLNTVQLCPLWSVCFYVNNLLTKTLQKLVC